MQILEPPPQRLRFSSLQQANESAFSPSTSRWFQYQRITFWERYWGIFQFLQLDETLQNLIFACKIFSYLKPVHNSQLSYLTVSWRWTYLPFTRSMKLFFSNRICLFLSSFPLSSLSNSLTPLEFAQIKCPNVETCLLYLLNEFLRLCKLKT